MGKLKKNQKGFSGVELLLGLILIALIGGIGFYVMHANNQANSSLDNADVSSNVNATIPKGTGKASSSSTPAQTDEQQITAVVKNYSGAGGVQTNAAVTVDSVKGDNAIGRVKSGTTADDGFAAQFIAHKDASKGWQVVYEGQQAPGSDIGKKYSLPQEWYSTDN